MKTSIIWFSTAQAAEHVGRHPDTVRKAVEVGDLHGGQRKPGGRWRIHRDCLNAWVLGTACPHRREEDVAKTKT